MEIVNVSTARGFLLPQLQPLGGPSSHPFSQFPKAAVTKYYTLGGLKQYKFILWQFWRLEFRAGCGSGLVPSGISQGRSVTCPSPSSCWFLETLCSLTYMGPLFQSVPCLHLACDLVYPKTSQPPSVGVFPQTFSILPIYGLEFSLMPPSWHQASQVKGSVSARPPIFLANWLYVGVLMTLGFSNLLGWLTELREIISLLLPVFLIKGVTQAQPNGSEGIGQERHRTGEGYMGLACASCKVPHGPCMCTQLQRCFILWAHMVCVHQPSILNTSIQGVFMEMLSHRSD